jgi:peptide/nickel transport system ATP-binding protein
MFHDSQASRATPVLAVEGLRVEMPGRMGPVFPVRDISLTIEAGETLGIVGESGAGKSMTGSAVLGLIEQPGRIASGVIRLAGQRIDDLPDHRMRELRGRRIGAIFQDPMTALDPLFTIGSQLVETIRTHQDLSVEEAWARAEALLASVGLPEPARRMMDYPHQMSGGMRQRVVIALALCNDPELLIADEPTTALDVSTQAQIIRLLKTLCRERRMATMLVTHDMGVIAEAADRVAVLYAGRIVEMGPVSDVLRSPRHPYTRGLVDSIPRVGIRKPTLFQIEGAMPSLEATPAGCAFHPRCRNAMVRCLIELPPIMTESGREHACWLDVGKNVSASKPLAESCNATLASGGERLLDVADVHKHFQARSSWIERLASRPRPPKRAVDGVSFHVDRGETFALVGESGCGKSTLARMIVGLERPTAGRITFGGVEVGTIRRKRRYQMIFQDPYSSLNPRWKTFDIIAEPIRTHGLDAGAGVTRRVDEVLEKVGMSSRDGAKYPHEFSGGQRQRISIARALVCEPEMIVCDEPTSALDVSVQAQILNLLKSLQAEFALTLLFISHDLAVVRHMADRIAVMQHGRIVESGWADDIFVDPQQDYTRALFAAVPDIDVALNARGAESLLVMNS